MLNAAWLGTAELRFSLRSDSCHSSLQLRDPIHTACLACLYFLAPKAVFPGKIHPSHMCCLCCPGSFTLFKVVFLVFFKSLNDSRLYKMAPYQDQLSELKKSNSSKYSNSREQALETCVPGNSTEYSIQSFKSKDSQYAPQHSFILSKGRLHGSLPGN